MIKYDDNYIQALTGAEIAVIGMSCRFPGADNYGQFWDNLIHGRESIITLTDEELLKGGAAPGELNSPNYIKRAAVINRMEHFAADFFGYNDKEAQLMDPQQRLMLECCYLALEDAGYNPEKTGELTGVFTGTKTNTYLYQLAADPQLRKKENSLQIVLGGDTALMSPRISYKLNLKGPSYTVQTACSTSLVAVHLACQSLLIDECRMALAGAVAINVPHYTGYAYQEGGILSADGHCRPFAANATGTIFGNGVGVVVLKRLKKALEDHDVIYAVIKGTATNNDGSGKATFTAPGVDGQAEVVLEALAVSGVDADTVSYVEAHGTGTPLGDPIEVLALTNAFRAYTDKKGFCLIGSVKSNVGHLDAASGICGLVKTVLALKHGKIPATLHFENPNPKIDFKNSPFVVVKRLTDWPAANGVPRRAGVSSFGFGGTNAHVLLEEAPVLPQDAYRAKEHLLIFSAKTASALERISRDMQQFFKSHPDCPVADAAHTLQLRSREFEHRSMLVCKDCADALRKLEGENQPVFSNHTAQMERALCLYFPGNASWNTALDQSLYAAEPVVKAAVDHSCSLCEKLFALDIKPYLFAQQSAGEQQQIMPLVQFVTGIALGRLVMSWGVKLHAIAGKDSGSLVSACLLEEIPEETAIRYVQEKNYGAVSKPALDLTGTGCVCLAAGVGEAAAGFTAAGGGQSDIVFLFAAGEDSTILDWEKIQLMLGRLWLQGVKIDWQKYGQGKSFNRIPLPGYPFAGKRYWIDTEPQDRKVQLPAGKLSDIKEWFYKTNWEREALPAPAASLEREVWLFFTGKDNLALPVIGRLEAAGMIVVCVKTAAAYKKIDNYTFQIRADGLDDYGQLIAEILSCHAAVHHIVHMWNVNTELADHMPAAPDAAAGFYSLLYLARVLGKSAVRNSCRLFVIANNLYRITGSEIILPAQAVSLGPCLVIPQEFPNFVCRYIDISPGDESAPSLLADSIYKEITGTDSAAQVALRGSERWVLRYRQLQVADTPQQTPLLKPNGVYLILGGLGGIGYTWAEYLAENFQARLALTGLTGIPQNADRDAWLGAHGADDRISGKIALLRSLEAHGAEVLFFTADAAQPAEMEAVTGQIMAQWGAIDGIIHAAGVASGGSFKSILDIAEPDIAVHFRSKIAALLVLAELVKVCRPQFCLINSSLSAVLGGLGNIAYAAANSFCDQFVLAQQNRAPTAWLTIDWDSWHQQAERENRLGTTLTELAILPAEGVKVFSHALALREPRLIVSTTGLEARLAQWVLKAGMQPTGKQADKPGQQRLSRSELEQSISAIWKKALNIPSVGLQDNFFDLGGDSLTGMQMIEELRTQLDAQISPVTLYGTPTIRALVDYLHPQDQVKPDAKKEHAVVKANEAVQENRNAGIAIIGIALRFPGADTIEDFWHNLCRGIESTTFFTDEELKNAGIPAELLNDPHYVKARPVINNVEQFDPQFFGYSPKEAAMIDPQHRVFLECAYEALENAGYDSDRYDKAIGVFGGTSISSYLLNLCLNHKSRDTADPLQAVVGNDKDSLTTSISYKLNLRGPSVTVQTFCSTSLVAVHLACQSLLLGECDMALAGGVSVFVPQLSGYHFQEGNIVSPDGRNRAFDSKANGTLFGNGAGVVVLKPLKAAVADGDYIYSVIKGSAINNDGSLKVGYTAPSIEGQAEVVVKALKAAQVSPASISYLEAHGTGTPMGDPIEIAALTKAFRQETDKKGFCRIGSVKTNLGHLDRASGVAALIKAALCTKFKQIPPSLHYENPNPKIDFENSPFYVNTKLTEWEDAPAPRRAGVSSLGFGGTNAHVIIEEPPGLQPAQVNGHWQLFPVSAKSAGALEAGSRNLAAHLRKHADNNPADIAYTLQVGRKEFAYRRVIISKDLPGLTAALEASTAGLSLAGTVDKPNRALAFIFSGMDTNYRQLGLSLYKQVTGFKATIDTCSAFLQNRAGFALTGYLESDRQQPAAVPAGIDEGTITRGLLFAVEYALAALFMAWGAKPAALWGVMQGEITAACLAGVFSLEAALTLLLPGDAVQTFRNTKLLPPRIPFIAGHTGGWITAEEATNHDYWLSLAAAAGKTKPGFPIPLAGLDAVLLVIGTEGRDKITDNMDNALTMHEFIAVPALHDRQQPDLSALYGALARIWLAGAEVDWACLHAGEARMRVPLPSYPFERKRCWLDAETTPANSGEQSAAPEAKKDPNPDNWFYIPSWKKTQLPAAVELETMAEKKLHWLVFMDDCGLAGNIALRLRQAGQEIVCVSFHDTQPVQELKTMTIAPAHQEAYLTLFEQLKALDFIPDKILHCFTFGAKNAGEFNMEFFDAAQNQGLYSMLAIVQAMEKAGIKKKIDWEIITDGLLAVTSTEDTRPEKSPLIGFIKVLPQEYAGLTCRCLDLKLRDLNTETVFARIINEIMNPPTAPLVAYRGSQRWLQCFDQIRLPAVAHPGLLKKSAAYLVTGGLTGLGYFISEYLAADLQAGLVIFEEEASAEDSVKIDKLKAYNADVRVFYLNLTAYEELEQALAQAVAHFKSIEGAIHASGVSGEKLFRAMAGTHAEECNWHFAAKVRTLFLLNRLLNQYKINFCLLTSSLASVLGGRGYTAYAASDNFMDAYSSYLNQQPGNQVNWISVNWDAWQAGGDLLTTVKGDLAAYAMQPHEVGEVCKRVFALHGENQILVSTGNLEARLKKWLLKFTIAEDTGPAPVMHPRPKLTTPYVAPKNAIERQIAQIWQESLGIAPIGIKDNYFELGGESFIAIKMMAQLKEKLGKDISVVNLYEGASIEALVRIIGGNDTPGLPAGEEDEEEEEKLNRRKEYRKSKQTKKEYTEES